MSTVCCCVAAVAAVVAGGTRSNEICVLVLKKRLRWRIQQTNTPKPFPEKSQRTTSTHTHNSHTSIHDDPDPPCTPKKFKKKPKMEPKLVQIHNTKFLPRLPLCYPLPFEKLKTTNTTPPLLLSPESPNGCGPLCSIDGLVLIRFEKHTQPDLQAAPRPQHTKQC